MFHEKLLLIISLLFAVSMLVMLGQKLKISYPIFLVIGGLLISLIPEMPMIQLDPQLVFTIFLPPILYEAAWYTSWNSFWKFRRPIGLLAFGLVFFTSCIVAFVSNALIPGFTLALGFLLGGIISPPDAVAATSVLKGIKMPKRIITILEGESLINDASSLIVFRFALAAVITGHFVVEQAISDFFIVGIMGIVVGLAIAHVFYVIHRFLPTNSNIDTAFTLMSPYIMFIAAEHFEFSGVLAVVSGGLFLSYRSHEIFNHATRIQTQNVWATIIFILNGLIFILIGLELPVIVHGLNGFSLEEGIKYGIIISLITIAIRFIWVYPSAFFPRFFFKRIREKEPNPGWKGPFVIGMAGMRGVVSLASALAIPLTLSNGQDFPQRNIILLITFVVILVTLVIQGLALPIVIKSLKVEEIDDLIPEEEQSTSIKLRLMKAALTYMERNLAEDITENELVENLQKRLKNGIALTSERLESLVCDDTEHNEIARFHEIRLELIAAQRKELALLKKQKIYDYEVLQKEQSQLDFDETKIHQSIFRE